MKIHFLFVLVTVSGQSVAKVCSQAGPEYGQRSVYF